MDCAHLDYAWPRVESERASLCRLVTLSNGPWDLYSLKAVCEEVSTFMFEERTFMDIGALEEAEVQRSAHLHALNLCKKAEKIRGGTNGDAALQSKARSQCKAKSCLAEH